MPNRLVDFEMDEGSLVDKGAHPGAKVLIHKNARGPASADLHGGGEMPEHYGDKKRRKRPRKRSMTDGEEEGNVPRDVDNPDSTDHDEDDMSDRKQLDREALVAKGLDDEVIDYIAELEEYADGLEEQVSKAASPEPGDNDGDEEPELEEVLKSLDPSVAELVSKSIEQNKELEERLNTEVSKRERIEDERRTEEFVSIAKSYRHIPTGMNVDEFAEVLKSLSTSDPENYEKLKGVLDASDTMLGDKNLLFEEVGKVDSGTDFGDGDAAEVKARELVSKSDGELSIEEARVRVLEDNPELYDSTQRPGR